MHLAKKLLLHDLNYLAQENSENVVIIACDEVGRGPLAGPVSCSIFSLDYQKQFLEEDLFYQQQNLVFLG